jgi:hypothetical protein
MTLRGLGDAIGKIIAMERENAGPSTSPADDNAVSGFAQDDTGSNREV